MQSMPETIHWGNYTRKTTRFCEHKSDRTNKLPNAIAEHFSSLKYSIVRLNFCTRQINLKAPRNVKYTKVSLIDKPKSNTTSNAKPSRV